MAIKEIKREWSPCQLGYVKYYLLHYESDVKDLPGCCVGSIATVSETDNEYICTPDGWKLRSECAEGSGIDAKVNALDTNKVALPVGGEGVDAGTAGQFAVSDGKGGIAWKTLVEAEEVAY